MSQFSHKNQPQKKTEQSRTAFEAKKPARIGSKKSPAKVVVQTTERKEALESVFIENKWTYEITVDAAQEENILDLEFLQSKGPSLVIEKTPNRNDPCSCGSGKKYKKCCG
jgi:SWIM/SEC-C metal-binding protein